MPFTKSISLHTHTLGHRFHFYYHDLTMSYNIFEHMEVMAKRGFTGLTIPVDGTNLLHLGGTKHSHFSEVKVAAKHHRLRLELETNLTHLNHLSKLIDVCHAIGADTLRVSPQYKGTKYEIEQWTVRDLKAVIPYLDAFDISMMIFPNKDNSTELCAEIIAKLNHPKIAATYDLSQSLIAGRSPKDDIRPLMGCIQRVDINDQILVLDENQQLVLQGCTLGTGSISMIELINLLYYQGVKRFCFKNTWSCIKAMDKPHSKLPKIPSLIIQPHKALMDGSSLPPFEAITQESQAFEEGWRWLRDQLNKNQFVVLPEK